MAAAVTSSSLAHDLIQPPTPNAPSPPIHQHGVATVTAGGPIIALPSSAGLNGIICIVNAAPPLLFAVPNAPDPLLTNVVWVQVTFHPHGGSDLAIDGVPGGVPVGPTINFPIRGRPGWVHRTVAFCHFGGDRACSNRRPL